MPFSEHEMDGEAFWRSPDVLLSNMAGEYAVGWAELIGPWEQVDGQMIGRDGAEVVWGTDACADFAPDFWLPLPARPNGKLVQGKSITLVSAPMYLKTVAETRPPKSS